MSGSIYKCSAPQPYGSQRRPQSAPERHLQDLRRHRASCRPPSSSARTAGSIQHTMATRHRKDRHRWCRRTGDCPTPFGLLNPHSFAQQGELDLTVAPSVDAGMSFQGKDRLKVAGKNPYPRARNLRLVMSGSPLLAGLIVRNDSRSTSSRPARDAGRRRIPSGLGAFINVYVHLRGANMTWKDVKVVPFGSLNDSLNALIQGRVDATVYGIRRAAHARSRRFRRHPVCDRRLFAAGKKRIISAAPATHRQPEARPAAGRAQQHLRQRFAVYLLASTKTSDAIVTAVLKALWDRNATYASCIPGLRRWTTKTAVVARPTVPYHPPRSPSTSRRASGAPRPGGADKLLKAAK